MVMSFGQTAKHACAVALKADTTCVGCVQIILKSSRYSELATRSRDEMMRTYSASLPCSINAACSRAFRLTTPCSASNVPRNCIGSGHTLQCSARLHSVASTQSSMFSGGRSLQQLGQRMCISRRPQNSGRSSHMQVQASFFGVGAPEAILVGIVALVIFGPQGLAEAAKTAGKTVRAFRPTINELTSVSRDLSQTLNQELGINEITKEFRDVGKSLTGTSSQRWNPEWDQMGTTPVSSNGSASSSQQSPASSTESDPDIEAKRAQAAAMAWGQQPPAQQQPATSTQSSTDPIADVSIEELQAELARRRVQKETSSD